MLEGRRLHRAGAQQPAPNEKTTPTKTRTGELGWNSKLIPLWDEKTRKNTISVSIGSPLKKFSNIRKGQEVRIA